MLDKLLHNNLIFNIPTGVTITKEMDIDNYRTGVMKISEILITDQIGNISTVALTLDLKGRYTNQVIDGKFRYLRVWKLFDNSWKVIAGSGLKI